MDRDLVSLSSKATQRYEIFPNSLPTKSEFIANAVLIPQVNFVKINFKKSGKFCKLLGDSVEIYLVENFSVFLTTMCSFLHFFLLCISVVYIYLLSLGLSNIIKCRLLYVSV